MPDTFDPHEKAIEIENDVKRYLDNAGTRPYPIEDSVIASQALEKVTHELTDLWKEPSKLEAVGKELEILSDKEISTLPNVTIDANAGHVLSLRFTASGWDFAGGDHQVTANSVPNFPESVSIRAN
jgi:hypothetical protein